MWAFAPRRAACPSGSRGQAERPLGALLRGMLNPAETARDNRGTHVAVPLIDVSFLLAGMSSQPSAAGTHCVSPRHACIEKCPQVYTQT